MCALIKENKNPCALDDNLEEFTGWIWNVSAHPFQVRSVGTFVTQTTWSVVNRGAEDVKMLENCVHGSCRGQL